MYLTLGISVFLALTRAPVIKSDTDDVPVCKNEQFIVDQHKNTQELVKSELYLLFEDLSESVDKKLEMIATKLENSISNLTELIHVKETSINLSMEQLRANVSDSLQRRMEIVESKMEKSFGNLSDYFDQKCTTINPKNDDSVADPLSSFSTNQSKLLTPQVTIVEELVEKSGTIEFLGREDFHLKRKMWIIRADSNKTENVRVRFTLEEKKLDHNAQLTVFDGMGYEKVFSNSDTGVEMIFGGMGLFAVTLTVNNSASAAESPNFKLRFNVEEEVRGDFHSSLVMTNDGTQFLSYPPENKKNYSVKGVFHALIAPVSGKPFKLTMKYLDVPSTSDKCDTIRVWFLQESQGRKNFVEVNSSAFSRCGRHGNMTQVIGHSAVAFVRFYPQQGMSETGKGFRMEVDNSD